MATPISNTQNCPVAGCSSTTGNESIFDLDPIVSAATNTVKTAIDQQATAYTQAERARRDFTLNVEFAKKRSERQEQFDAETETEQRERILAFLKPKLKSGTYLSVLADLGISKFTPPIPGKTICIDLTSEDSSSVKGACDDHSTNREEVQSSTVKGSSSRDISKGKTMVEEALNETSSADSGECGEGVSKSKDGDGDCASHDSLAAPSMPGSSTSNVGASDNDSSAQYKPSACTTPHIPTANVATTIQDSFAAPTNPVNAVSSHRAADNDSSSVVDKSDTSTAPATPTTRASTTYGSSPLDKPNFTEATKDTNTSPTPKKLDSTESEQKAGFAKFASQAQASALGSQTRPQVGASFSPFIARVAGQSLPGFGSELEVGSPPSSSFPLCTAGQSIGFGSGRAGGIISGSSAEQGSTFEKPDSDIAGGGTKRGFQDISGDDDNSDGPSHKRARTDGDSNPTAEDGHTANVKVENPTETLQTLPSPAAPPQKAAKEFTLWDIPQWVPPVYPPMAPQRLHLAGMGSATTANTPAAPSSTPHRLFGTRTYMNVFNTAVVPLPYGQDVLKYKNTASGQDATHTEISSNIQDATDTEDRSKSEDKTDGADSTNSESIDNDGDEEIL